MGSNPATPTREKSLSDSSGRLFCVCRKASYFAGFCSVNTFFDYLCKPMCSGGYSDLRKLSAPQTVRDHVSQPPGSSSSKARGLQAGDGTGKQGETMEGTTERTIGKVPKGMMEGATEKGNGDRQQKGYCKR